MTGAFRSTKAWGAELDAGGRARFRLWAPGQKALSVATGNGVFPMQREPDGWFSLEAEGVAPNSAYSFVLEDGRRVPDPAARAQMGDVHGPSRLVDPAAYKWRTPDWKGRPWTEAVIYELHTGTFTPEGTFGGVEAKLDHLASLGVTALELMPVAQFSGARGWGYDGVLLYAPHAAYGGPEALKSLVDAAHARGLMVLLDVVYNHFGPDGNYIGLYAPDFFTSTRRTPWGDAIDYTRPAVRRFVIDNALYWLEEFRFDGLRFDAIDQIHDPSTPHILEAVAAEARSLISGRRIHLTTEDDRNIVSLHVRDADGAPTYHTAEWNDDVHHVMHVLATGESDGYYQDYVEQPSAKLARALCEGYVQQGEPSAFRDGERRGERSDVLPPSAFVDFLQNHDQIGNRAFGERLSTLAAPEAIELLTAILLLSPHTPLLFMGEEWGEARPFLYFTDFHGELAAAVRDGRRNEFRKWRHFQDPAMRAKIPDPNALSTFEASRLDWDALQRPPHDARLALVRRLLALRAERLTGLFARLPGGAGGSVVEGPCFAAVWRAEGLAYRIVANPSAVAASLPPGTASAFTTEHEAIFQYPEGASESFATGLAPPWSGAFILQPSDR